MGIAQALTPWLIILIGYEKQTLAYLLYTFALLLALYRLSLGYLHPYLLGKELQI